MTEASVESTSTWLPLREAAGRVARSRGCTPEAARSHILGKAEVAQVRVCGVTSEGYEVSLLPASCRGFDWDAVSLPPCEITNIKLPSYEITNIKLRLDDLIAADLLPGKPEGRRGWWAAQTLAWIIRREPGQWTPEMGKEIKPAKLKLSEAIAARRINLWGRQPGSLQFEQISNDLFRPSRYKVIVTFHGDLSTEPPHKRHEFEQEYKDDCGWHDIIFAEDESRREWLPAGRAASAHEPASEQPTVSPGPEAESGSASPPAELEPPAPASLPPDIEPAPAPTPRPGGRPPALHWETVDSKVFRLMDHNGEFCADDPDWNAQARLENAIADFCETKFGIRPGETTIRDHIREPLRRWRQSRSET